MLHHGQCGTPAPPTEPGHSSRRLPTGQTPLAAAADNLRRSVASSLREPLEQGRRCQGILLMMHGYDKDAEKCPRRPGAAANSSNHAWARLSL